MDRRARASPLTIVNIPDISPADDRFVELGPEPAVQWVRLSGLPANPIERRVRGLRLSRYRAAAQAVWAARSGGIVISHLPVMSAAVATGLRLARLAPPHLAFSFNFTTLPEGRRRDYFRKALAPIDRFAVYSQFERTLYARHFDLDPARLAPVLWTQATPVVAPAPIHVAARPYVCAVGGEGRDFAMLLEALRMTPTVDAVLICRPQSLAGLAVPDHVRVMTDVPYADCWRIAQDSIGVLVPLRDEMTCCGHVTLVSAKLLGIPIATTFSQATIEYVEGRPAALSAAPGDPPAFARLIEELADRPAALARAARDARAHEQQIHDRALWGDYVARFIETFADR